jgi:tRNA (guanine-N7-)-methyltransferase
MILLQNLFILSRCHKLVVFYNKKRKKMQQKIKSYVLRAGRVSPRQQKGNDQYLIKYCLPKVGDLWDLDKEFARKADTIVEIGFGMGASLLTMAQQRPEFNFIGIEVHGAGIGSLSADLNDHGVTNVRIAPYDATEVFANCIQDNSLAGIQVFFPDPWPKKRHQKRRLIQAEFVRILVQKLKPGGFLHCATDWEDYAQQMLEVLSQNSQLKNQCDDFMPRPEFRPLTKFEKRGSKLGHGVWDLFFIRQDQLT